MGNNGSEVFDNDANMKSFLDKKIVELFSLDCNRCV